MSVEVLVERTGILDQSVRLIAKCRACGKKYQSEVISESHINPDYMQNRMEYEKVLLEERAMRCCPPPGVSTGVMANYAKRNAVSNAMRYAAALPTIDELVGSVPDRLNGKKEWHEFVEEATGHTSEELEQDRKSQRMQEGLRSKPLLDGIDVNVWQAAYMQDTKMQYNPKRDEVLPWLAVRGLLDTEAERRANRGSWLDRFFDWLGSVFHFV